ncbi:Histone deacetylase complex subunit [Malassezia caprae]|uniref:Histone deacetylase complex subunit n=1 Tax=Malassezia caprae TaxID=1381934 RepID=A0AAF0E5R9_9BASI|nr:Histone deacetylase complex subunit [Malassezia caprae]
MSVGEDEKSMEPEHPAPAENEVAEHHAQDDPSDEAQDEAELPAPEAEAERTPTRRSRRMNPADDASVKDEAQADGTSDAWDAMEDAPESTDEGVTRCVCGSTDENLGLMIQCETCKCWQHCSCMGMHTEDDCPDVYYCEQCRPENHTELLRSYGFLPAKVAKRGASRGSRQAVAKESARELQEAREAIRVLAEENAARLRGENVAEGRARGPGSQRSVSKRRTMNSRDIGEDGWEQIPPGLLLEKEEPPADDESDETRKRKRSTEAPEATPEPNGGPSEMAKRRRLQAEAAQRERKQDEEKKEAAERSRKERAAPREESKPRHPNQYTYRGRQETPVSAVPPRSREARRVARDANSRSATPLPDGSSHLPSHTMPEHLAHLAYLQPPTTGDEEAAAERVAPQPGLPEPFALITPIDPSIKIRYPQKRMTMGEMRKRVRAINEYVTRVQIEAVEREKRVQFLGSIVQSDAGDAPPEPTALPMSMRFVEQLTDDLNQFQRRFGAGAAGAARVEEDQPTPKRASPFSPKHSVPLKRTSSGSSLSSLDSLDLDEPTSFQPYKTISRNVFVSRPRIYGDSPVCQCHPDSACDERCINRFMQVLCNPRKCPCGKRCTNTSFDKRPSPPLDVVYVGARGWGLVTPTALHKGQYLGQYCGELIYMEEAMRRAHSVYAARKNYYFIEYDASAGEVIDAGLRGNKLRFVNHSCEPNCYFEKWLLSGSEEGRNAEYQLALFALRDIRAGEEITYDYGWSAFQPPTLDENGQMISGERCLCGAPSCTGWLARIPKKRGLSRHPKDGEAKTQLQIPTTHAAPAPSAQGPQRRRVRRQPVKDEEEIPMRSAEKALARAARARRRRARLAQRSPTAAASKRTRGGSSSEPRSYEGEHAVPSKARKVGHMELTPSETPSLGSSDSPLSSPLSSLSSMSPPPSSPESSPLTPCVLVFEPSSPMDSYWDYGYEGPLFDPAESTPDLNAMLWPREDRASQVVE